MKTSRSDMTFDSSCDVTSRGTTPPRPSRRQRARSADPMTSGTRSSDHLSTTISGVSSSSSSIHQGWYPHQTSHNYPEVWSCGHCPPRTSPRHEEQHPPSPIPHLRRHRLYHSDPRIHHHHHHYDYDNDQDPPRRRRRRRRRWQRRRSQVDTPTSYSQLPPTSSHSPSPPCPSHGPPEGESFPPTDDGLHLSLCGCGFLGVYHLGVLSCLLQHGPSFLARLDTVSGASTGALAAALLVTAPTLRQVQSCTELTKAMVKRVRSKPLGAVTPGYQLTAEVRALLDRVLPPDAHLRARGRLQVSVTALPHHTNSLLTHFESRDHLIEVLVASCHVPAYSGVTYPSLQGKAHCTGTVTNNLPRVTRGRTVTVSPFSGRQDIGPRDNLYKGKKGWFFNLRKQDIQVSLNNLRRLSHAIFPPSSAILQQYYEQGHKDASRFLVREGLYEILKSTDKPPLMYESSV